MRWEQWEKDTRIIRDQQGPVGPGKESLRLRIPTGDFVAFSSAHRHSKRQMLQKQAAQKNVDVEDAARQRQSLLRDFDRGLGRHGEEEDFNTIGQNMVRNSGGAIPGSSSAFNGAGALLGNIQDLLAEGDDSEDDEMGAPATKKGKGKGKGKKGRQEAEERSATEPGGVAPAQTSAGIAGAKKKEAWFDAESRINRSSTSFKAQAAAAKTAVSNAVAHAIKQMAAVAGPEDKQVFSKEIAVAAFRCEFADAVLTGADAEAVRPLRERVTNRTEKAPCGGWDKLLSLAQLQGMADQAFEALSERSAEVTPDDVEKVVADMGAHLLVFADLAAATKTAGNDILSAKKTWDRLAVQKLKRAAKEGGAGADPGGQTPATGQVQAKRARKSTRPVFEYGASAGRQIKTFATTAALEEAFKTMDPVEPFILTDPGLAAVMVQPETRAAVESFTAAWKASPSRASTGRASQKIGAPADATARAKLIDCVRTCALEEGSASLSSVMAPRLFAISAGTDTCFIEQCGFGSIRLSLAGAQRAVVMVPAVHLCDLFSWKQDDRCTLGKLCTGALSLTQEAVRGLALKGALYSATIGANELLFTPAGMVVCELVSQGQGQGGCRDPTARDVVGMRACVLLSRPQHARMEVTRLTHFHSITCAAAVPLAGNASSPAGETVRALEKAIEILTVAATEGPAGAEGQPQQQAPVPAIAAGGNSSSSAGVAEEPGQGLPSEPFAAPQQRQSSAAVSASAVGHQISNTWTG